MVDLVVGRGELSDVAWAVDSLASRYTFSAVSSSAQ